MRNAIERVARVTASVSEHRWQSSCGTSKGGEGYVEAGNLSAFRPTP